MNLSDLQIDGGTQTRASLDESAVNDYADAIAGGATLPPVTVYFDGEAYWLADGFHRIAAHKKLGRTEIDADVRQGTRRDAVLHSVGANATHGLRRTNEDKRRAVMVLIEDEEWSQWSNREVARRAGVDETLVRRLRPTAVKPQSTSQTAKSDKLKGRDGKLRSRTASQKAPTVKPPSKDYRRAQKALEALLGIAVDDLAAAMSEPHDTSSDLTGQCESVLEHLRMALYRHEMNTKPPKRRLAS